MKDLLQKINTRQANLAVIGLGYVGLPVACAFADAGFEVLGVEIREDRVQKINAGVSPIEGEEPGLAELLAQVIAAKKLRATSNYEDLRSCDVVLIDVETPVDEQHKPRYEALRSVLYQLGPVIKTGTLVIVESTIAPGTMQKVVCPILEETSAKQVNEGFFLGNCPERVMPGKLLANLKSLSRVCGGCTQETAQAMVHLYRHIVQADLDPADWITGELVKTVENAYRDVQIAFANEVAMICEALGGDVWKVRELVNKSPYRQMHMPGAGVGGHCIPKDPWLLVYGVESMDVPVRLIPAARAVNDGMPGHVMEMLEDAFKEAGRSLNGSRVLVMGYAYLEDSDDTRNSPSELLVKLLQNTQAVPVIHDPYVAEYHGAVYELAQGCDAAVVMVSHQAYKHIDYLALAAQMRTPILIERRRVGIPADERLIVHRMGIGVN